jgi:UDP-3-O-[3-hydroxymyristoyl] glucosamine N-acyltransferase
MTEATYKLAAIAAHLGAELEGDPERVVRGPAPIEAATSEQIAFAEDARYLEQVTGGAAGAVLVGTDFPAVPGRNLLRAAQPRLAFLRLLELFAPRPAPSGIHPQAVVHPSAELGAELSIGPCAVIGEGARIGAGCRIHGGAYIGARAVLGAGCEVHPNATLYDGVQLGERCLIHAGATIGGEGFGFQWLGDHHHKVPQLGTVVLEDDVEVGCNSCIDRATLSETRIGRGTKIDNQVHVAHNNAIGRHVILLAHVVIAGSGRVGDGAILSGQVGVSDHINIGAGVKVGGSAGVTRDVADGEVVWGTPARPMQRVLREQAAVGRLPELLKQFKAQQQRLVELQGRLERLEGAAGGAQSDPAH